MSRRILVADDSSTIQKVIKIAFSRLNTDILEASSFLEAISALSRSGDSQKPEMLIVDASLPGARSPADFRRLAIDAGGVPVLLLVGSYEAVNEDDFRAAGFQYFLKKPFESGDIVAMAEKLLGARLAATATSAPNVASPPPFSHSTHASVAPLPAPPLGAGFSSAASEGGPVTPPPPGKAFRETMIGGPGLSGYSVQRPELEASGEDKRSEIRLKMQDSRPSDSSSGVRAFSPFKDVEATESIESAEEDDDQTEDPPSPWNVPPPPLTDETRKGRKAFTAPEPASIPVYSQSPEAAGGDFSLGGPDHRTASFETSGSNTHDSRFAFKSPQAGKGSEDGSPLSEQLLPLLEEMLPMLVRQAVEDYCNRHFKSLAREIIASELRRLADEKARHLVDN